jgi:hypothetical protein
MTLAEARRVADLIATMDGVAAMIDDLETWTEKDGAYIVLDFSDRPTITGEGGGISFNGPSMPRDIAIEMAKWLRGRVQDELDRAGVSL